MPYGMDHIETELAGIAARLEVMERERADEKRLGRRTPSGLVVPKTVTLNVPSTAMQDALLASVATRLDHLEALVTALARTQRMQQDAIEELCIMVPGEDDNSD